jgi:branched-subunit amino acid aminotransferase/4-amino-4-deoxychorismate lyase
MGSLEVYVNGQFLPASQATVSVQDRGLLYGDGLFETLRAEAGRPLWLRQHLERLAQSAAVINLAPPRDFPWESKIRELLERNDLGRGLAAVKILITRGEISTLGLPETEQPTIIIYTKRYEPPPPEEYRCGWPVVSFPERRTTFLGRYKSLNYLFCLAARQYAGDRGGREGLILEADGTVSEGSTAGVLWQEGNSFFTPRAHSALASVTTTVLGEALSRRGAGLKAKPVIPERLALAEGVWLGNSLIGLLPVSSLDGHDLAVSDKTVELNELLWSEAG